MPNDTREPFSEFWAAMMLAGFTVPWASDGDSPAFADLELVRAAFRRDALGWRYLWVEENGSDWTLFLNQYGLASIVRGVVAHEFVGVEWDVLLKKFDLER